MEKKEKKKSLEMPQCLIFLLESPGLLGAASGAPHANGWCNEIEKRVKQLSCEASRQSSSEDGRDFPHLTKILISFLNKLTLCREESQGRHITPPARTGWPGNAVGHK